jgi:hypothetical protein
MALPVIVTQDELGRQVGDDMQRMFGTVMQQQPVIQGAQRNHVFYSISVKPSSAFEAKLYELTEFLYDCEVKEALEVLVALNKAMSAQLSQQLRQQVVQELYGFIKKWLSEGPNAYLGFGRDPHDMDLNEILLLLNERPERFSWLHQALFAQPSIIAAEKQNLRWVRLYDIPRRGTAGINIAETMRFVEALANGEVQETRFSRNRLTIEQALGYQERQLMHPVTGKPGTTVPAYDLHFGELPEEFVRAIRWAFGEKTGIFQPREFSGPRAKALFASRRNREEWSDLVVQRFRRACDIDPVIAQKYNSRFHESAVLPGNFAYPQPAKKE